MTSNITTGLKKFTIIAVALMGIALSDNWPVCAGASNDRLPNKANEHPNAVIVGQSQTGASNPKTNPRTSESSESESQTQEEQNSEAAKKKPLKDFQPTEKIEADQAVDFPYDI
jgi:hypothetical protein